MSRDASDISDKQVIESCLKGDQSSFYIMIDRYHERSFWTAYKYVHNTEDAEDITQDAFLKAFNMLARFDTERNFFTWLYRIVVNAAIDFLRRKSQHSGAPIDELGDILPDEKADSPSHKLEQEEMNVSVYKILEQMTEPYKSVLILRELEGKSSKEIGEILDVPHATVRWRLHHARKIFRDLWFQQVEKLEPGEIPSGQSTENNFEEKSNEDI